MRSNRADEQSHLAYAIARLNRPDCSTLAQLLRQCSSARALDHGRSVHEHILKKGHGDNLLLQNLLIQMYGKCGCVEEALQIFEAMEERNIYSWNLLLTAYAQSEDRDPAHRAKLLFDRIPNRDDVSWNILIAAYARNGRGDRALLLLALMDSDGFRPNQFTFLSALEACGSIEQGRMVHRLVSESKMEFLIVVGTAIVTMYGRIGQIDSAKDMFDRMPHKNVITWNAMLAAYTQSGNLDKAKSLFHRLSQPDVYTWTTMLTAFGQKGDVVTARSVFESMPQRNTVSWNAMVCAYAANGHLESARAVFDLAPLKNTESWNSMISGYVQYGHAEDAIQLFRVMDLASDPRPNTVTFVSVLNACASWPKFLLVGRTIHEHLSFKGLVLSVAVETALVDMYGKCGALDQAREIFDAMRIKSFVSWNAMLAAYAQHSHGSRGLELFQIMNLDGGASPDDATMKSVLTACTHVGSLRRGRSYFADIVYSYWMRPTREHYVCMIDLLGRAGQSGEAMELVHAMPFEPNAVAWTMVLGSCTVSGDVGGGNALAENFVDDNDPALYLLLSNIHALTSWVS